MTGRYITALYVLGLCCVSAQPYNTNDGDSFNLDFIFGNPSSPAPKGDGTSISRVPSRSNLDWSLSLFPSSDFFNDINLDNGFNDDDNYPDNRNTNSEIGGFDGGKDYHDNGSPYGDNSNNYDSSPVKPDYYGNSETHPNLYPQGASLQVYDDDDDNDDDDGDDDKGYPFPGNNDNYRQPYAPGPNSIYPQYPGKITVPTSSYDVDYDKKPAAKKCRPEFAFDFEGSHPFSERYNRIWMGSEGNVFPQDGAAVFQGGFLYIPFFTGNDLRPAYRLSLLVKPKSSRSSGQTIVSNNFSWTSSTFSLALIGNKIQLVIIPRYPKKDGHRQNKKPVILSLPINQGSYTYVSVEQDDITVKLTVGHRAVYAQGRIPAVSNEPLYMGAGGSPLGYLDRFYGKIDSLVFDKCPGTITRDY
ncbi:uncharacterized protein LOC124258363 [Haliotis rubra]|uniref:uncharacterized protein LOC124258363 n=1 Tax=Haliotis rubra TaxID=36100 RepID=UPI001EE62D4D|nr:uncharacterized protein LOC124258363 [Haliotis rubra]